MNKILTDTEYRAQGFEEHELPLIRKHDELFNECVAENFTDEKKIAELEELAKILKL